MKLPSRVLPGVVLLAAVPALASPLVPALAASDDLTYCTTLYDMAVKYRGRAIQGESKPDPDMIVALEQCKHGNAAAGIATLEHKLRDGKINIPPR
jgi:hypothetical protein